MNTNLALKLNLFKSDGEQTLPRLLLFSILPLVLVPLFAAGGIGYAVSRNNGMKTELEKVNKNSSIASLTTQSIFDNKTEVINTVSQTPEVLELFNQAATIVADENLSQINLGKPENVAALEKQFAASRQLAPNAEFNAYLKRLLQTRGLAEIFITDRRGLTLAAGEPTSDFVQSDEKWWNAAMARGIFIDEPEFGESSQEHVLAMARRIYDASGKTTVGAVKIGINTDFFEQELAKYIQSDSSDSAILQLFDTMSGRVITTSKSHTTEQQPSTIDQDNQTTDPKAPEEQTLVGGEALQAVADDLVKANLGGLDQSGLTILKQRLNSIDGVKVVGDFNTVKQDDNRYRVAGALITLGDRYYSLSPVADTDLVAINSETINAIEAAGRESLRAFIGTSLLLSLLAFFLVILLARNIANPIVGLTHTTEEVAEGKLNLRVDESGTAETKTLARSFNRLLDRVQNLLQKQEELASEQGRQRQELEDDVMQLMEDVGDASEGDLTVRAQLSAGDVGIVADLFNSIIENLRDTAMQVKSASGQVSTSLDVNAAGIRSLATQAINEANTLRQTMKFVEGVSASIQTVSSNANEASKLTDETFATVQDGNEYMDKTVASILSLRSTVGETAKKIKRLGESAQKISQTVSLIDEIALKTNLLAVNASVEAARAGELGQGFTAVAEQVGALAEQSASATKEIAQIVAAIQAETQEVVGAIETGTAQVVDSAQLVESTKQRLTQVLQKSAQINQLMQSISESTTAQNNAAAIVTKQVKSATLESEQRAQASEQMARAIQDTADIARSMRESVAQFKVDSASTIEESIPSLDVHAEVIEEVATTA